MSKLDEYNYFKVTKEVLWFAGADSNKSKREYGADTIKCLAYLLTLYQSGKTVIKKGEQDIETQNYLEALFVNQMKPYIDGHYVIKCNAKDIYEQVTMGKQSNRKKIIDDRFRVIVEIMQCAVVIIEVEEDGILKKQPCASIITSTSHEGYIYFQLNKGVMDVIDNNIEYKYCNVFNLFKLRKRYSCMLYLFLTRYQDLFNTSREYLIPHSADKVYEMLGLTNSQVKTTRIDEAIEELNDVIGLGITLKKKRINEDSDSPNAKIGEFIFHVEHPELLAPKKLSKKPTHNTNRLNINNRPTTTPRRGRGINSSSNVPGHITSYNTTYL